jgi:anti-sigma B factor antagonist
MKSFFKTDRSGEITLVRFTFNEINLEEREELKKELQEELNKNGTKYVIDLSKVGFVSSLVIATILFFSREVKAEGGSVKLSGLSKEAYSVFQLTKLDKVFELYDTEEEAVNSF